MCYWILESRIIIYMRFIYMSKQKQIMIVCGCVHFLTGTKHPHKDRNIWQLWPWREIQLVLNYSNQNSGSWLGLYSCVLLSINCDACVCVRVCPHTTKQNKIVNLHCTSGRSWGSESPPPTPTVLMFPTKFHTSHRTRCSKRGERRDMRVGYRNFQPWWIKSAEFVSVFVIWID